MSASLAELTARIVDSFAGQKAAPGDVRALAGASDVVSVVEDDVGSGATNRHVLVSRPGEGSVVVSMSTDASRPWGLIGARRWRERDILRVNHKVVAISETLTAIEGLIGDGTVRRHLVDCGIIGAALAQATVEPTDTHRRVALERFRRARRLWTADATRAWLAAHGYEEQDLEMLIAEDARLSALREQLTAPHVDDYFAAHARELDELRLLTLAFRDRDAAEGWHATHATVSDAERLMTEALASGGPQLAIERQRRGDFEAETGVVLDGSRRLVGPIARGREARLHFVLETTPATLDAATRELIEQRVFDGWLAEQRRNADVEWYIGVNHET